jgi:hypothetical protein
MNQIFVLGNIFLGFRLIRKKAAALPNIMAMYTQCKRISVEFIAGLIIGTQQA